MPEGLSSGQARERLLEYGPNEPAPRGWRTLLIQFLLLFANPLVAIILIAGVVSLFLGQWIDGSIIVIVVLLGVAINFLQTWRSQLAADRLREQVAPTAPVLRDGEWREIPRSQVVPGDVLKLSAGDLIPADARILESRDLYVQ